MFNSPRKSQSKRKEGSKAKMIMAGKADKLLTKLAFLNGETDKYKLAEIGGCCEKTLVESWLPEFEREKKRLFLSFRNSSLQLGVTEAEFEQHLKHIEALRTIADQGIAEIRGFDKMKNSLLEVVKRLEDVDDFDMAEAKTTLSMLNMYIVSKKAYDTAVTQYIKVTNEWSKASGVEAHHSAAAGRIKEAERLRGKDDAGRNPLLKAAEGDAAAKATHDPFFGSTVEIKSK